ncbi:MAG: rRNA maturation RNase YbeY [Vulcanococcus sp.]|jgi:probable rRNA maturation factor
MPSAEVSDLTPDLDLAFEADDSLAAELRTAAGDWADPMAGAELWHERISDWLRQMTPELPAELQAQAYSLGLSLVGDAEIAELNSDWRGKSGPTDVLAFAAQDDGLDDAPPIPMPDIDEEALELGDIVISLETAARQAPEHGHALAEELLFLATHGLLHLLGWDHPDDASLAAMLAKQQQLLGAPEQR